MKKNYWWLGLILLVGLALRVYHNTDISLWHDEAFSALMIRYPWGEMFWRLAQDVHPPMYYIFLRFWHYAFGNTMWSLRGFSVFFGVLCIPAAYFFVCQAFKSEKMALWAAVLVAINPFQLQYVTEARMYTMGAFFAIVAAYFLAKALREQKTFIEHQKLNMPNLPEDKKLQRNYLWHYVGFIVSTAVIILTHYYLFFTTAAFMLYGLFFCIRYYRADFKKYLAFLISCALIGICFIPWLRQFLGQLHSVSQSYWIPDMTWWSIPSTLWSMLLGFADDTTKKTTQYLLIITTLVTIFFLWRFIRKTDRFEKWLVLFAVLAPFIGSVLFYVKSVSCAHTGVHGSLVCHGRSVYEDRYFLFAAVFYSIAFAAWLAEIKNKTWGIVLFTAYVITNAFAVVNYWQGLDITAKPGMAGAAKFLGTNVESGQNIFLGTSFEFFNYKYYEQTYYPTPAAPLLYTGGRSEVSQMSSVEGSALLSNSDLAPTFEQFVHPGDTEWVIWTQAFGSNKPAVPSSWIQIDEQAFPDVRPYNGTVIYVTEYRVTE